MSDKVFLGQPAFILHQQPWRESSYLIEALTRDYGKISLVAKGVRKAKSKTAALLRPFQLLDISYFGLHDLKTLTSIEASKNSLGLAGMTLFCGYYINELLHHLLHSYDPHPEVFHGYQTCLEKLAEGDEVEGVLRKFELDFIDNIGYGIQLDYDGGANKTIAAEKKYQFNHHCGLVEDAQGVFTGMALLAMQRRHFSDPKVRSEAKILTRTILDIHLQGKQLKSRTVLNDIVKRL